MFFKSIEIVENLFLYICSFILFLLPHQNLEAQEQIEVLCQVIDKTSNEPIIYATILLKKNKLGVISDEDGNFRIPIRFKEQSDTLRISSIGYKTTEFALIRMSEAKVNVLMVAPKIESLQEVTLVSDKRKTLKLSARKIVKSALQKMPLNYPQEPFSYIAYYRDYQQLLDSAHYRSKKNGFDHKYINLNEGIIEVFDAGFGTNKLMDTSNQTALYDFKINQNFAIDSSLAVPYDNRDKKYLEGVIISPLGGNELNILNLTNAIRNFDRMSFSFVHVLNKDFLTNHTFNLVQVTYLDDISIYEINFRLSAHKSGTYMAEGTIFIAKNSFAIHKLTYNLYEKEMSNHLYGVSMEYIPYGEQYYLNYITFNNSFKLKLEDYFKIIDISYNFSNSYFRLSFNHTIDENTLEPWDKNFKIDYKNQRLKIIDVQRENNKELKITVPNMYIEDQDTFGKNIRIKLKNIRDINGEIVNEIPLLKVNQFREIFVQEVFPKNELGEDLIFVRKNVPLSHSKTNSVKRQSHYWINTPLKSTKKD